MPRTTKIRPAEPRASLTSSHREIHLYGWDSRTETWHGPNELCRSLPDGRLLRALETVAGRSWYGPINCSGAGAPAARFFVLVHDLCDSAIASIYCDESKAGPAEILAVLSPHRPARLRDDFAFEFLSFARFLGSLGAGQELPVHEGIESALAERREGASLVVSICSGLWPHDMDHCLSRCVEKVAVTLCHWLDETPSIRSSPALHPRPPSHLPLRTH